MAPSQTENLSGCGPTDRGTESCDAADAGATGWLADVRGRGKLRMRDFGIGSFASPSICLLASRSGDRCGDVRRSVPLTGVSRRTMTYQPLLRPHHKPGPVVVELSRVRVAGSNRTRGGQAPSGHAPIPSAHFSRVVGADWVTVYQPPFNRAAMIEHEHDAIDHHHRRVGSHKKGVGDRRRRHTH
jgi:hypothetical protein